MGFSILQRNRLCSIIISWFRLGSGACLPTFLASCSIIISWFRLEFQGLSPYSSGTLFHHHFLVPARVPGLPSLLESCSIIISGLGSGACLPLLLALCSIIISWFQLGFPGLCPYSFGILFHHNFLVPARVPGLVSYIFGILFHHHFLVPARVPVLVPQTALELNGLLNSSKKQFCSITIFWFRTFWHSVPSSCPDFFGSG